MEPMTSAKGWWGEGCWERTRIDDRDASRSMSYDETGYVLCGCEPRAMPRDAHAPATVSMVFVGPAEGRCLAPASVWAMPVAASVGAPTNGLGRGPPATPGGRQRDAGATRLDSIENRAGEGWKPIFASSGNARAPLQCDVETDESLLQPHPGPGMQDWHDPRTSPASKFIAQCDSSACCGASHAHR